MVVEDRQAALPTLAEQVSKLYELVTGYHATHLFEIGRELGVWETLARNPGLGSEELATSLGTHRFYTDVLCRDGVLLRAARSGTFRVAHGAAFRSDPGDPGSSFYVCAGLHTGEVETIDGEGSAGSRWVIGVADRRARPDRPKRFAISDRA